MDGALLVEKGKEAGEDADECVEGPVVAPERGVLGVVGKCLVGELEGDESGEGAVD